VNVPTLEGTVEMNVPAGTDGSRTLRLRGKGLASARGARGDLLVALRIVLPEDAAASLGEAARTMAASKPYDPRKALG
jgi:DnaJ-class molecular chaperone